MDIHHRLSQADSDALARAVAASGNRDALWLVSGTVALFGLSLALPLAASPEGLIRLLVGVLIAASAGFVAFGAAHEWNRYRTRWVKPVRMSGLEPGARTTSFSLRSLRDVGPLGERSFRWETFMHEVEAGDWIALVVSHRECVALPKSALKERGLADAQGLARLIGRGER